MVYTSFAQKMIELDEWYAALKSKCLKLGRLEGVFPWLKDSDIKIGDTLDVLILDEDYEVYNDIFEMFTIEKDPENLPTTETIKEHLENYRYHITYLDTGIFEFYRPSTGATYAEYILIKAISVIESYRGYAWVDYDGIMEYNLKWNEEDGSISGWKIDRHSDIGHEGEIILWKDVDFRDDIYIKSHEEFIKNHGS